MELAIVLVLLFVAIAAGVFGIWLIFSDPPEWRDEPDEQLQAQLRGLRAANRLNVAFRQAHEALEAEADQYREKDSGQRRCVPREDSR